MGINHLFIVFFWGGVVSKNIRGTYMSVQILSKYTHTEV